MTMWTEYDVATRDPAESDFPLGPASTATSILGQVITQLDNLPTQHPHYALLTTYINQAKDELLTLGLAMGKEMLDHLTRLRNWRWWGQTTSGTNRYALPERMLYLEAVGCTQDLNAYSSATSTLHPMVPVNVGDNEVFGFLSRSTTGFPTMWRRAGGQVEIWPVPSSSPTNYLTTIVVQGTRMDNNLSANTDTLLMSPRLQEICIDLAAAIAMEKMGWEEAATKRTTVEAKLGRLISPGKKERHPGQTIVAGTPR